MNDGSGSQPNPPLRFHKVNRQGFPGYRPGWQRHHLIPRQLLANAQFNALFAGVERFCIEDFRTNGLLLPAREALAWKHRLPLHRGPHRLYNEMVEDRIAIVERAWSRHRESHGCDADSVARERLSLIQAALRRRLRKPLGRPFRLSRKDPVGTGVDFSHLDSMAEDLWRETEPTSPE